MTKPTFIIEGTPSDLPKFNSSATTVNNETFNLDANLYHVSLPIIDMDTGAGILPGNINIAFRGKKRLMVINGEFRGSESEILAFINELDNETKSSSQPVRLYTNAVGKSYYCQINNFTYSLTNNVSITNWTLELFTTTG